MDTFMEYYFEGVFSNMDRDCLNERYKRRELVEYFNTVIAGCARGTYSPPPLSTQFVNKDHTALKICRETLSVINSISSQNHSDNTSCKNFVMSALRYHNNCKTENGEVCRMGKYHNLLYVAMKLAFDWSLQDNEVMAALLDEIYACEKTFERIFLGAIFGTSAPYFLAGWKSDFMDKEENVHALVFYLDHATNANLEYKENGKTYRFIDVPLESCGHASPVRVVIQMGASEMLMILLRFGARIMADTASTNPLESILDRLNEYNRKYPYELVSCLKLAMRAVPSISLSINKTLFKELELPDDYNYQRKLMLEKYGDILADHLVPTSRCGLKPVELKHLSRCAIRQMLWQNFELPFGIQKLPIPLTLQRYLDLCDD